MEVFVKRENWDGGIWIKLPASEEQAEQVLEELAGYHPSRMIPFIGDVKAPVAGLAYLLIGEFVFQDSNLGQLNYLAAKLGSWSEQERAVFETILQNEKPDSLLRIVEAMDHLDQYECHPEIKSLEQYGHYLFEREGRTLPVELTGYFDYEAYGRLNMKASERLTDEGLVTRIKAPKPAVGKKQNPEVVQPRSAVFRVHLAFDKRYPEKICFYFPMTEKQLEALEEKCRTYDVDEVADYLSNIWELDQFLPPRLTFRELNQIAMEIQNLADKTTVSRKKLLASLEAEVPRDTDAACRIIRNYKDYEFLSVQELSAKSYAKYLLNLHQIYIEKELEPYVRLQEYGLQKMKENGPVETIFGTLICKGHPIQKLSPSVQEFRLYNSLAVTAYWNGSESFVPELLSGEELLSYESMIREKIQASLKSCPEKGLAEYLFSELLKKRVASMMPDVEAYAGSLWGVLTVRTYGELNDRELAAVMDEWKAMADSGWGEELFYRPIRTEKGEIYIGFWDTDNNDNLFIKTEEEFRRDCLGGSQIGQELQL
ncbi:antirestriction protein ArdA [Enterocloster bolteae]|uniref:antirestriction protein ArdA n=1 Tax=Enterocloster bolteae TaxID=208479 RepID=UPI001D090187|nr:antirestriction protein ArdA [Enterocloster bolteae]MCB6927193.1 antirestriction protein ArdA [Enterocloster bolteae]